MHMNRAYFVTLAAKMLFKEHACCESLTNLIDPLFTKKPVCLADSICQMGKNGGNGKAVQSREWCKSFPSVNLHYLEGCGQPAWPHPRFYRGADRDTGLS